MILKRFRSIKFCDVYIKGEGLVPSKSVNLCQREAMTFSCDPITLRRKTGQTASAPISRSIKRIS